MAATRLGIPPPAQVNIRPNGRYRSVTVEDAPMPPVNSQSKTEAVAYVSRVLGFPDATQHDFQFAMALSERFDIQVRDILEYRKKL